MKIYSKRRLAKKLLTETKYEIDDNIRNNNEISIWLGSNEYSN